MVKHPKARILVVEDDAALLQGLMDLLVFNGYEVHGSADGSEGLRAALEAPCDLVLLDVMLPGLDGLSVCRGDPATQAEPGRGHDHRQGRGGGDRRWIQGRGG